MSYRFDWRMLWSRFAFAIVIAVLMVLVCAWAASAQEEEQPTDSPAVSDSPTGSPYRVGPAGSSASISLRDFMSSRVDHLHQVIDERDRQYAQRFEAQQQALNAALAAAKEAVANALQAAKEAVTKAEDASNKRFDSVNEFRQTLTDQASSFMSKAEADARLKAVEQDISDIRSRSEGANNLWIIIGGLIVITLAAASLALNLSRRKTP